MVETQGPQRQRAVLVALDTGEYDAEQSLEELGELAEAAGAQVVARMLQRRPACDPATVLGAGRLEELAAFCKGGGAELVLFDRELSPAQVRNLERACGLPVVDRTGLILDIFAQRAVTAEGKLQVELAQLQYQLPRLGGQGAALSRLGGGIGTRGPGETQLETDRRHIRRRITALKARLAELEQRRRLLGERRKKQGVPTVAIVGYTNVGKSTLLNALTQAGVLAEDKLFATLDPTSRALTLPDGRQVLLIDTVGLVRRLPHQLVEAFHSTLEAAVQADLIWCVCDIASPEAAEQVAVTRRLLAELGAAAPQLVVLNKGDLVAESPLPLDGCTAVISAKTGFGLERLLQLTAQALPATHRRMRLLVPYGEAGLLNALRQQGRVFSQQYLPEGILADALVEGRLLQAVAPYQVREL